MVELDEIACFEMFLRFLFSWLLNVLIDNEFLMVRNFWKMDATDEFVCLLMRNLLLLSSLLIFMHAFWKLIAAWVVALSRRDSIVAMIAVI